jgi:hypothetical protein
VNARATSWIATRWCLWTLIVSALLCPLMPATAISWARRFDVQWTPAGAIHVLRLTYDSRAGFVVKEVLKRADQVPPQWNIDASQLEKYPAYARHMLHGTGPLEMIAFLSFEDKGKWHFDDLVFLDGETVLIDNKVSPDFTRTTFLDQLRKTISCQSGLATLLALPATPERIDQIVPFLIAHEEPGKFGHEGNSYLIKTAASAISGIADASDRLLGRLAAAKSPREQMVLIGLIGEFRPPPATAYDRVVGFLDRSHPGEVRRAAIMTLDAIDRSKAVVSCIPYLTLDDPDLIFMMHPLGHSWDRRPPAFKHPGVFKPLADLALTSKKAREFPEPFERAKWIEFIHYAIIVYDHPRHIPLLLDWAQDAGNPNAHDTMVCLGCLTGVTIPDDPQAWRAWWERSKKWLVPEYDLRTNAGIDAWLKAAAKAEPDIQKILLKLWDFEPVIDETTLIEAARTNPLARNVLAKLWSDARLSVNARKAIMKNHVSFRLEQMTATPDEKSERRFRVRIAINSDFSIPAGYPIEYSGAIVLNGEPALDDHSKRFRLADILDMGPRTTITGSHGDRAVAHALVQLREIDPSKGNALLWELNWRPEPLEISDASK